MNLFISNISFFKGKAFCLVGIFMSLIVFESSAEEPSMKSSLTENMPYDVKGITYYPLARLKSYSKEGIASWYGPGFHGKRTSNQEVYNMNALTAAHKTLPFGTRVRIHNLDNGLKTVVRINDRGPFVNNRIIDLSRRAAKAIGMLKKGTARVRVTALGPIGKKPGVSPSKPFKKFSIQAAVFKLKNNARAFQRSLTNSRVQAVFRKGQKLYRVLVGKYSNYKDALKGRQRIRNKGFPEAFIVPVI